MSNIKQVHRLEQDMDGYLSTCDDGEYVSFDDYQKLYDELICVLKQINKEEMNSIRPGGSPSTSARISYEALKKFGVID